VGDGRVIFRGTVLLKVPFHSNAPPEPRSVQVVPESGLAGRAVEYMVVDAHRASASKRELGSSQAPCLVVSNPSVPWWKAAVGSTSKAKVLPLESVSWVRRGATSIVFEKWVANGMPPLDASRCFTIMTPARSLDFVCFSAEECASWVLGLETALFNLGILKAVPKVQRVRASAAGAVVPVAGGGSSGSSSASAAAAVRRTASTSAALPPPPPPAPSAPPAVTAAIRDPRKPPPAASAPPAASIRWSEADRRAYWASTLFDAIRRDDVDDLRLALDDGTSFGHALRQWS